MILSGIGAAFIRSHEGFVAKWYKDPVGIETIGIGFTWRSDSFRHWWRKNKPGLSVGQGSMSRAEADEALIYLCKFEYGRAVNRFLNKTVPQHVFDGMVSVVYNLGPRSLKWKWAAACKDENYERAATLLRQTGTTAKGRTLAGLVRRRAEEAKLIEKGVYSSIAGSQKINKQADAMADGVLRRRERGPAVRELIVNLKALGYYDGRIDDIFGPGCERAVISFQRDNSLKADGYAGPKTLKAIAEKISRPRVVRQPAKPKKTRKAEKATVAGLLAAALAGLAIKWNEFTAWLCNVLPFCQ